MANEHPKFEDNVPQFSSKINEQFVHWITSSRETVGVRAHG